MILLERQRELDGFGPDFSPAHQDVADPQRRPRRAGEQRASILDEQLGPFVASLQLEAARGPGDLEESEDVGEPEV